MVKIKDIENTESFQRIQKEFSVLLSENEVLNFIGIQNLMNHAICNEIHRLNVRILELEKKMKKGELVVDRLAEDYADDLHSDPEHVGEPYTSKDVQKAFKDGYLTAVGKMNRFLIYTECDEDKS